MVFVRAFLGVNESRKKYRGFRVLRLQAWGSLGTKAVGLKVFKVPGIDPCRFCICGLRFRALRVFWGTGLLSLRVLRL